MKRKKYQYKAKFVCNPPCCINTQTVSSITYFTIKINSSPINKLRCVDDIAIIADNPKTLTQQILN